MLMIIIRIIQIMKVIFKIKKRIIKRIIKQYKKLYKKLVILNKICIKHYKYIIYLNVLFD